MGKITDLPTTKVLRALRRAGWQIGGGSKHYKLLNRGKPGALTVPRAARLKKGAIVAIIRQAGLTVEEFWRLYK